MAFPSNFKLIRQQGVTSAAVVDKDVAARFIYIGPRPTNNSTVGTIALADWLPAVAYTVSGVHFDFYLDATAGTKDLTIGTAGRITTTEGTLASLAATVNASANWRMVLVGGLPADRIYEDATKMIAVRHDQAGLEGQLVATNAGAPMYFDTEGVNSFLGASMCVGAEAETANVFAPIHQRMSEESIVYKRDVTDVKDAAFAHHIADQPTLTNTCAFLAFASTAVKEGTADAVTTTVYAATQTSSRVIMTKAGDSHATMGDAVTTIASSDLGYDPLIVNNGERIVVRVIGAATLEATVTATGGYGYLLT